MKKILPLSLILAASLATVSQAQAANLVVNGSFEANNTGFTSAYTYVATTGPTALWNAGTYAVGSNPNAYHSGFAVMPAQNGTNMMIVNGAGTVGTQVWGQTVNSIAVNTTYYFSTWVASVNPNSPATMAFSINGTSLGSLQASAATGLWTQFYGTWNSGANTSANISLVNLNTAAGGNDFALDNIVFDTVLPANAIAATVPAPATGLLLATGLIGLLGFRRKQGGLNA